MGIFYDKVKSHVQIEKVLESSGTDEESKKALKKLRPLKNGIGFKELIKREDGQREKMQYNNRNYSPIKTVILSKNKKELILKPFLPQNELIRRAKER